MSPPPRPSLFVAPLALTLALGAALLSLPSLGSGQAPPAEAPLSFRRAKVGGAERIELRVKDVVPLTELNTHAVILLTADGTLVPLFVETPAAVAIAFRLAGRPPPHPLAEDTLDNLVHGLGGDVSEVEVRGVRNVSPSGVVHVRQGGRRFAVAARPSDSIAMALSSGAKIFCPRALVRDAGITRQELESLRAGPGVGGAGPPESPDPSSIRL